MYWKYVGVGIQFDAKNKYEKLKIYTEYMLQNVIKNETSRIYFLPIILIFMRMYAVYLFFTYLL